MSALPVIVDDVQLRRRDQPLRFIYLTAESPRVDDIVFIARHSRWDEALLDNVDESVERVSAVDFSAWWLARMREGWQVNRRR